MPRETLFPATVCPSCGHRMDRTTDAYGDATPRAGDVSLCIECGEAMIFDHDLSLRLPTEQERLKIGRDPLVILAQRLIRAGYAKG